MDCLFPNYVFSWPHCVVCMTHSTVLHKEVVRVSVLYSQTFKHSEILMKLAITISVKGFLHMEQMAPMGA